MIQFRRFSIFAGVLGSTIALSNAPVQAASFTAQDVITQCFSGSNQIGPTSCNNVNGFFDLTANPTGYHLTQKQVGGVKGIGIAKTTISADSSHGEIDPNESLHVGFKKNAVLSTLQLSFLYQPDTLATPGYGDKVYEVALVNADGISNLAGTLTVTGTTSAIWSGVDGTVANVKPSIRSQAGSYKIFNPFGNSAIAGFNLTAVEVAGKPKGAGNSDFTLSSVDVKVPEPATVAGLGLVGLLAASRRRRMA
jgi:hypothetical protein